MLNIILNALKCLLAIMILLFVFGNPNKDGAAGGAGVQLHPQPRAKYKLKKLLIFVLFVKWALPEK